MLSFLQVESVARNAATSHFLLMFGYKLFSFFFPLFLLQKGFSLPEVGYTYLLIYLPLALAAPFVGILNHRINPALLSSIGIGGYGLYSLAMMYTESTAVFFLAQVLLGLSAALFFASMRAVLMGSKLQNPEKAFGWFYSAPLYVEAAAPLLGAFLIWKFGFFGVFAVSLGIYVINMFFTLLKLYFVTERLKDQLKIRAIVENYVKVGASFFQKATLPFLAVSFAALLVGGAYRAFFVLFLKELGWADVGILAYGAVFSLLFVPAALYGISLVSRQRAQKSIVEGGALYALSSILFGLFAPWLHFGGILLTQLVRSFGGLITNTGRSGLLTRKFSVFPEEAGALDTVFAPLGVALGSLGAGLLIGHFGYMVLFVGGGLFVGAFVLFAKIAKEGDFS